jgi:hypothetical protein
MTQPFVSQLRARGDTVHIAGGMTVRVEVPEVWDTIKADVAPETTVAELKVKALDVLYPFGAAPEFVVKLRGFEVLDEGMSLHDVGAVDGSIFLLTHRRRRPVR